MTRRTQAWPQRMPSTAIAVWMFALSASPGVAQDAPDRDYRGELPRIAPTEPAEALATMQVADGFRIEQVAAEPLVVDPVAFAFDEDARLFVVEMRGYSEDADQHLGRVRLLEDQDGDGRFDESFVYADGFSWPTAILCWDGGVLLGAAPDILWLKDTDGDRVADVRRVVFTGFGRSNVQGLLNSLRWGLDNQIHGATSSSGAEVVAVAAGGAPGEPLVLRGRDFAIDPRGWTIRATSGGGQHGLSFNRWGDKFVCSNSDHIQHVTFEDRYVARNAYFAAPAARRSIAEDGPQADVFRSSPVEPWRIVRTRLRVQGLVPGPVEGGGTPAGYFTGATGVTIYDGNAWPSQFLDWAVIGDVGSNLVHRKRVVPRGVSYAAQRVDARSEFVRSSDIWFRPAQFANAPDGTLYLADMYREVIEHPLSLPPVIKQHLDLTSGRDRGRIYRIVPAGFRQPPLPRLSGASPRALVALLQHDNGWHRETAARLLVARQDRSVVPQLEAAVAGGSQPAGRIRCLYVLDRLAALTPSTLLTALEDPHPRVRQHALRLAERLAAESTELRERMFVLVADPSAHVRHQLAFSLGELDGQRRNRALGQLVRSDGLDPDFRVAIFSSLANGAGELLADLALDAEFRATGAGRRWLAELAAQIGKQRSADDIAATLDLLRRLSAQDPAAVEVLLGGLAAPRGSELAEQVAAATGGRSERLLEELLRGAARRAADAELPGGERAAAVALLRLGDFAGGQPLLEALLEPNQPVEVQEAAVTALATFRSPRVPQLLLERWPGFSPRLRGRVADVLFSRPEWLPPLLDAVDRGQLAAGDVGLARLRLLAEHSSAAIRSSAAAILDRIGGGDRSTIVERYGAALERTGDALRGKALFKELCSACHQLEGVGHAIAPNLAAMQNRGAEAILVNVLDPNRELNPLYLQYALETTDGRLLSGMIEAESSTSVTLVRANAARDTVLRIDIQSLRSLGVSLMPEGLEKQLDQQQMADLLAYLAQL